MLIGIPTEVKVHEYRVGLTPASVKELIVNGHSVFIQHGAGLGIGITDHEYEAAGGEILSTAEEVFRKSEMIIKVKEPQEHERAMLWSGQVLFTYLHLAADRKQVDDLLKRGAVCIAYETVMSREGTLPLLMPMSEVAGRLAIQVGARFLEKSSGGSGVLLSGVPGVEPAKVVILGAGVVGRNAARIAVGMGADVSVIDRSSDALHRISLEFGTTIKTVYSTEDAVAQHVLKADLVVGGVLVPGETAPKVVTLEMLRAMKKGAVMVDVAIDQGGCFETSKPTTHAAPTYEVEGIIHYCVTNMPGCVPYTSTLALNAATLPYVLALANQGWEKALRHDPVLRSGLNICGGQVTCQGVSKAFNIPYADPASVVLNA